MKTSLESAVVPPITHVICCAVGCVLLLSSVIAWAAKTDPGTAAIEAPLGNTAIVQTSRESALTGIESWAPADAVRFKAAESCYDAARDEYAIAAVYTRRNATTGQDRDAAFLLRIAGDEGSGHHGQMVHALAVGSASRIDHVDCTADDSGRIYVAFDRYGGNAVWYRYEDTDRHGPFAIAPSEAGCHPYSHMPRITVSQGDSPTLFAAFEGYSFVGFRGAGETQSCEACVMAFDALGGQARNSGDMIWNDNMTHGRYDVLWNADDRFLWALPYAVDAGSPNLAVYTYDESGSNLAHQPIQNFHHESEPGYPELVELVYSDIDTNAHHRIALITDQDSVYWLNRDGSRYRDPVQDEIPGFAACGYLGTGSHIAHTFHTVWHKDPKLPGPVPVYVPATAHRHWKTYPATPRDPYEIAKGHRPVACSAGSPRVDRSELLLVSATAWIGDPKAYWHFQVQH